MKSAGLILNHELVTVRSEAGMYRVRISMSQGGFVEHEPFPLDQRGLVAALSLAIDVLAGKIWLSHAVTNDKRPQLPATVLLKGVGDERQSN